MLSPASPTTLIPPLTFISFAMCQYDTSGIEYACGHYIVTSLDRKHDCGSPYCEKSSRHPPNCNSFHCNYMGPDRNQKSSISTAYCDTCQRSFFSHLPPRR
ncbi:hypothetical protein FB45DRAFT_195521 [Roridomyces roridus]|uniref:Uncharacterized protein n=1 Tax=Roridomyces roridus TaxID=1738132 RepID=A0AAD7CF78_9AGAR|nr:hypothetical protein FB45DRAFT_195521 [Roridomyces roridus]